MVHTHADRQTARRAHIHVIYLQVTKNPRVTCTAQDMSPELSLEHVCLLVCAFVRVIV